jgi:hypothetical protein
VINPLATVTLGELTRDAVVQAAPRCRMDGCGSGCLKPELAAQNLTVAA